MENNGDPENPDQTEPQSPSPGTTFPTIDRSATGAGSPLAYHFALKPLA